MLHITPNTIFSFNLKQIITGIFFVFLNNHAFSQQILNTISCKLKNTGTEYYGICLIPCQVNALNANFDKLLEKCTEISPARNVNATLRQTDEKGNYLGKMEGKYPEDPTRFEISDNKYVTTKVAKLPFGWFPVQDLSHRGEEIFLTIDAKNVLPATLDDLKIIERTIVLLGNEAVWDKNDTRTCLANPKKWSLFCALTQATVEISGGVHYRQPAHEKVREVLNEVGGDRVKTHRLMDYNNHPQTTLNDVHQILIQAKARIQQTVKY